MIHSSGQGGRRTAALALGLLMAGPAHAASLTVRVEGVRSEAGLTYVSVCTTTLDPAGCPYSQQRKARSGAETFIFQLPPGAYAVAAFHDENGNGTLDRNLLGLPTEPYAFSNDAGRRGAPTVADAAVQVGPAATTVVVRVRRVLGD